MMMQQKNKNTFAIVELIRNDTIRSHQFDKDEQELDWKET